MGFKCKDYFTSLVWAGVRGLTLNFADGNDMQFFSYLFIYYSENHTLKTGFEEMETRFENLNFTTDQFFIRWVKVKRKVYN